MTALEVPKPAWMDEELVMLEDASKRFFEREIAPDYESWVEAGCVTRTAWQKAGEAGLLCAAMPEEYGGAGGTFAHENVITHVLGNMGFDHFGIALHSAIVAPYILHYGSQTRRNVGCRRWPLARISAPSP